MITEMQSEAMTDADGIDPDAGETFPVGLRKSERVAAGVRAPPGPTLDNALLVGLHSQR
jgi:hypothetical protein